MGTWGAGSFENDEAAVWRAELTLTPDESAIEEGLRAVADASDDEDVEDPESQIAIAAAEVVAAVKGRPSSSLRDDSAEWARKRGATSADVLALARRAVTAWRASPS